METASYTIRVALDKYDGRNFKNINSMVKGKQWSAFA